jgi:PAS domain S-box-containing protein
VDNVLDFILLLLTQFAGGPGPVENNLVRFGLPVILWGILLYIALARQRSQDLPREKLLVWGFGLALLRELYMFSLMSYRLLGDREAEVKCDVLQPLEHGLAMAAMIMVAGAFLLYILEDQNLSKRYLQWSIGFTLFAIILTSLVWPRQFADNPQIKFHQTWVAWLFHVPLAILMGIAVFLLMRKQGWLRNVVSAALALYLISELLLLLNYATDRKYNTIICPIGNSLHILAIPLFGYVYLKEQSLEKKKAEESLLAYQNHLEDLVDERTAELTVVNTQLKQEVFDRTQAEKALERVTRRYELILESTGEGICGIDRQGTVSFANPAAAQMLGYTTAELINSPGCSIWHRIQSEDKPHSLEACPIYQGHSKGIQWRGDDEFFWRKDGGGFPIRYFSNPVWEKNELVGSVLVFQDITERKRHDAEIAQRNASLAMRNTVAALLSQSLEIENNLSEVLKILQYEMEMEFGLIFLRANAGGDLIPYISRGSLSQEEIQAFTEKNCLCQPSFIKAMAQNRAVLVKLSRESAEDQAFCSYHPHIRSLIAVPLVFKGETIGLLSLASWQIADIQPHQLERLTAIGLQIGMAIENARLYQDAENRSEQLTRLHEASSYLISTPDLDQTMVEIARQSAWLLRSQKAGIIHLDRQTGQFELAVDFGLSQAEKQSLLDEIPHWVFLNELIYQPKPKTIIVQDVMDDHQLPDGARDILGLTAMLITPILTSENPGEFIIVLETNAYRHWHELEIELIESLANRAAVALMNVNLHHQRELAATLEERQRIAANMHDGLAQTLSLLGMRVDRMQEIIEDDSNPETEEALREIRDVVTLASTEVRRSIASLQEAPRPRSSLQDLLQAMLENIHTKAGPVLQFDPGSLQPLYLVSKQTDQVLPAVHEALLNAFYHAKAQTVSVRLEVEQEYIRLTVEDDGVGFSQDCTDQDGDHFGLSIMQARAARMGGQFQIDTSPGKGTRITLTWTPEYSESRNSTPSPALTLQENGIGR